MAKKLRYPPKYRAKLEKIAAGREARQAAQEEAKLPELSDGVPWIFRTLFHEFFMQSSVSRVYMNGNADNNKGYMEGEYWINADYEPEYALFNAPWLSDEPAS